MKRSVEIQLEKALGVLHVTVSHSCCLCLKRAAGEGKVSIKRHTDQTERASRAKPHVLNVS